MLVTNLVGQTQTAMNAAPDFRTLRVEYRKNLLGSLLEENYKYRDDLRIVERKLAACADYTGALRARNERHLIEQEVTAMEQEIPALGAQLQSLRHASLPDRIVLLPKDARLTGYPWKCPTMASQGGSPRGASLYGIWQTCLRAATRFTSLLRAALVERPISSCVKLVTLWNAQ